LGKLLVAELLKLKRSRMVLLTLAGAAAAPFMVVVSTYIHIHTKEPGLVVPFSKLFFDVNLYASLLTGIPLYGVAAAWLYSREYTEDTLKNLLTIPVSRTGLLLSKLALLFLWILTLAVTAWALTLTLGLLGGFGGLSASLLLASFKQFTGAAALLFALCTPVICIALVMRHLVPAMIFSIAVTMVTVMGSTSEYKGLIPWSAAFDLVNGTLLPVYPALYSYVSIAATSIAGLAAALIHFERTDIP